MLDAFRGYSLNQRKKFLEDKDGRSYKYAVAYLRVLLLGIELLKHNSLTINVKDQFNILGDDYLWNMSEASIRTGKGSDITFETILRAIKSGVFNRGYIIDWACFLEEQLVKAYEFNPNHTNNPEKLNDFLLKVRKENW